MDITLLFRDRLLQPFLVGNYIYLSTISREINQYLIHSKYPKLTYFRNFKFAVESFRHSPEIYMTIPIHFKTIRYLSRMISGLLEQRHQFIEKHNVRGSFHKPIRVANNHGFVYHYQRGSGIELNRSVCSAAAAAGELGLLQWARANGARWDEWTYIFAKLGGHDHVLHWLSTQNDPRPCRSEF